MGTSTSRRTHEMWLADGTPYLYNHQDSVYHQNSVWHRQLMPNEADFNVALQAMPTELVIVWP